MVSAPSARREALVCSLAVLVMLCGQVVAQAQVIGRIAIIELPSNFGPPPAPNLPPSGGWVQWNHADLQVGGNRIVDNRIVFPAPPTGMGVASNHATEVASRLFPDNGRSAGPIDGGKADPRRWRATSYQATWTNGADAVNVVNAINAAARTSKIINMSFGAGTNFPGAANIVRATDENAWLYRNVVTVSAGNSGPGASTIGAPANAYNVITVGATNQNLESRPDPNFARGFSPAGVAVADFSSRGPTQAGPPQYVAGRHKPDIVAPGTLVRMAAAYGNNAPPTLSNTNTARASGTSFAAPYVASVAAHLIEKGTDRHWDTDPSVVKAVLLNSAQQVGGWNGWTSANTKGDLDTNQGAGEVSTPRADVQYLTNPEQHPGRVTLIGWDHNALDAGSYLNYVFNHPLARGNILQATLDWYLEFNANDQPFQLDNLYLQVWRFNGLTPVAMVTQANSDLDNVQDIHRFVIPANGTYGLRVFFAHDNDGVANPKDDYGLAWYTTLPEPSTVTLLLTGGVFGILRYGWRRRRQAVVTS